MMGDYPLYNVYRCADGGWLAVSALELSISTNLFTALERPEFDAMLADREQWPGLTRSLSCLFLTRPRDHWISITENRDAGVTPVLSLDEAASNPQTEAREMVVEFEGLRQVGITPKMSHTPGSIRRCPASPGANGEELLSELGMDSEDISGLRQRGIID